MKCSVLCMENVVYIVRSLYITTALCFKCRFAVYCDLEPFYVSHGWSIYVFFRQGRLDRHRDSRASVSGCVIRKIVVSMCALFLEYAHSLTGT